MSAIIEQVEIILEDEWKGVYKESWTGVICPDAFAHPAKFSRALIRAIYDHVVAEGWATKGDSVVDPFGGVALGGLDAMRHGLNWYGCELEAKFHGLGNQNIALWNERYSRMPNWGSAVLLNGDSRKLAEVLSASECCVSSPPYIDAISSGKNGIDWDKARKQTRSGDHYVAEEMNYGSSDGQLGAMKEGDRSIAITSPPFPQPHTGGGGINENGYVGADRKRDDIGSRTYQGKGGKRSEGNLEALDASGFEMVVADTQSSADGNSKGRLDSADFGEPARHHLSVSSPPFENIEGANALRKHKNPAAVAEKRSAEYASRKLRGHQASKEAILAQLVRENDYNYGSDPQNVGNQKGETFWSASRTILEQLHQVLTPRAHAVFVVKSFVRNKQIVDFPDQWAQLCEAVGFKLLHHHRALLTEDYGTQETFDGEGKTLTIARKSFFRRLAESKGSPRIDWESVLCFEKR